MLLQNNSELHGSPNQLFSDGIVLIIRSEMTGKSDDLQDTKWENSYVMHYTDTIEIHSSTAYMVLMKSLKQDTRLEYQ